MTLIRNYDDPWRVPSAHVSRHAMFTSPTKRSLI